MGKVAKRMKPFVRGAIARPGDPTPERLAKGDIVRENRFDDHGRLTKSFRVADAIDRIDLTTRQVTAASTIRDDWEISQGVRLDDGIGGSGPCDGVSLMMCLAGERYDLALQSVEIELRHIVLAVARDGVMIGDYAIRVGHPNRQALASDLKMGLTQLANHYRLPRDEVVRSIQIGGGRVEFLVLMGKGGVRKVLEMAGVPVYFTADDDDALHAAARRCWLDLQKDREATKIAS